MNPFDHHYFIGYVSQVTPQFIKVHFPSSVLLSKFVFSGEEFNGGLVGNFVVIEGENHGFIGQLQEIELPEKERLALTDSAFRSQSFHPTAKAEILIAFNLFNHNEVSKGSSCFPNIGAKVFVCSKDFIQLYVTGFGIKEEQEYQLHLGNLISNNKSKISLSQQAFFGRHSAIVGTTGGGKSWTISKLIEETTANGTKCILIDPTGEYASLSKLAKTTDCILSETHSFSYKKLTISDLFFLLKPGEKVQGPKLLEAVRSLKAVELANRENLSELDEYFDDEKNSIIKTQKLKKSFIVFSRRHTDFIDDNTLEFNIQNLAKQINSECVSDSSGNDISRWGNKADFDASNCISLITRVRSLLNNKMYRDILNLDENGHFKDLATEIDQFLKDPHKTLLRIGFEKVGFDFNIREIIANAIATYLLYLSRKGNFQTTPIILMVDEAHQFLNKHVSDDSFNSFSLNAFDQIAKECRKYGLFLCIATQMPRDIPIGTLSQMGTFLVHRLINYNDKEAIRQSCGTANNNTLAYLPILSEGEAILTGVDFPMPLLMKVDKPSVTPNSGTPKFNAIAMSNLTT